MDDDPVLRSLGEDLARDDPRLAALLTGAHQPARRGAAAWAWFVFLLLAPPLVTLALLLPPTVVLGVIAMTLAVGSPLAVCWLCGGDRTSPGTR